MDGILIIDKPAGITSHDVVARCRRILKTKKVGHTGTLDPFATGVVVALIGKATRLAQFLDKDAKEYEAVVRLGFETETGDLTGEAKGKTTLLENITPAEIENALTTFRGEISQTPPMYSAKKVAGKKLYELARRGIEIERKPVNVNIYELELLEAKTPEDSNETNKGTQDFTIRVACSAGTYIRTLAEDIGRQLNTAAHLTELRRTRAGKFALSRAVTLERLEELAGENDVFSVLVSMNEAVSHLPEVKLSEDEVLTVKNGIGVKRDFDRQPENAAYRLTDGQGELVAIGLYSEEKNHIQPRLVLI